MVCWLARTGRRGEEEVEEDRQGGRAPEAGRLSTGTYGYILAQARRNPVRTGATVATVAVAMAFLVIVASLSVGLRGDTEPALLDHRGTTPELPIADFVPVSDATFAGLFAPRLLDPTDVGAIRRAAQESVGSAEDVAVYPLIELSLGARPLAGLQAQEMRLIGVDPALGVSTPYTSYHAHSVLARGMHLRPGDGAKVVLGYTLWEEMYSGVPVGTAISLAPRNATWWSADASQLRSGGPVTHTRIGALTGLVLVGVLDRNVATDLCAFVTLSHLANATGAGATPDGPRSTAVSVEVKGGDVDVEALAPTLAAASPRVTSWYVTTVREGPASGMAEGLRSTIYGWLVVSVGVTFAAMVLGVSNTVLLSVSARRREIGMLRALGLSRREVVRLVTYEALFLVMMGWGIGFFSGHIVTSTMSAATVELDAVGVWLAPGRTVLSIVGGSMLAAGAAALLGSAVPARRAAALAPAVALSGP